MVMRWGLNDAHYRVWTRNLRKPLRRRARRGDHPRRCARGGRHPGGGGVGLPRRATLQPRAGGAGGRAGARSTSIPASLGVDRELFADDGTHLNDAGRGALPTRCSPSCGGGDGGDAGGGVADRGAHLPAFRRRIPPRRVVLRSRQHARADVASDLRGCTRSACAFSRVARLVRARRRRAGSSGRMAASARIAGADLASATEIADGPRDAADLTLGDDGSTATRRGSERSTRSLGASLGGLWWPWSTRGTRSTRSYRSRGVDGYVRAVKRADPGRLVTVSISGEWDAIIDGYERIDHDRGSVAPHSPRKNEVGAPGAQDGPAHPA